MPELPEVEITRRHLAPVLGGALFEAVEVTHPRTARHNQSNPKIVSSRLLGRRALAVERSGKFIVIPLDNDMTMVAHLGMSGRFVVDPDVAAIHTHFRARLDSGRSVEFVDPRTFGFIAVFDQEEIETSGLARIGPDAWENPPDVDTLAASLRGRVAPIKALLLDQGPISGLGNIYADECLFLAQIDPRAPGGSLDTGDLERLLIAIRQVLATAIDNGGTSLDDLAYLLPDGRAGENLNRLMVYGRDGEPCRRCGEIIDRVVIRARSTHFCPGCQVKH
ncbi:MAG TPA: bifunctional DNA-formamidopyrimidine glycosylase/DNA-(apurinic or apyrimidinic site) lyase [Acidimicrobiia bacterium]